MKLFLTSAGLVPETTAVFLKLLDKKPEETRMCLISTASFDHYPEGNAPYIKEGKNRLSELGFKNITDVDLRKENGESLKEKLENFDVVFVGGGNTFYLMKYARESGFDKALGSFLDRGGIYVGVSAGSIIIGKDISSAGWSPDWDENAVGLKDLRGIGLVDFIIVPHYITEYEVIIKENKNKVSYPIFAITDFQAISVESGKVKFVGPGEFRKF
ncbi:MAG: Type 1 glutamine amidotransferase-like domain-containing protein [Candidatus Nealsonbacteria bacterium]|nr:Type 1 glutamine amidotransferase-like domain-containing protein [Candidatus Nealsonbacteria bacterium]